MTLPYALMPVCRQQHCDPDGVPYDGGVLHFYEAGTSTPASVYSTADGSISLGTSITLDAGGYAPAIYLAPGGYKVVLKDSDGVTIWTQDGVEDVGLTFLAELGDYLYEGGKDEVSGYTVLVTDQFVTIDSTGGADPCQVTLCPAADHPTPLVIKNMGTVALQIWPYTGDTIEGINDAFSVAAAASPNFPSVTLLSDGASGWLITASHGL